jgi:hypothetical protein
MSAHNRQRYCEQSYDLSLHSFASENQWSKPQSGSAEGQRAIPQDVKLLARLPRHPVCHGYSLETDNAARAVNSVLIREMAALDELVCAVVKYGRDTKYQVFGQEGSTLLTM